MAREAAAARLLAQRPRDVLAGERAVANASAAEAAQTRAVVALRSAHGTYLSAAMDRRRIVQAILTVALLTMAMLTRAILNTDCRRVVQAATLGLTEVFEERAATSGGGGLWLRSHYGTCVSVWYDGSAHQNAHCGAWETFQMTRDGLPASVPGSSVCHTGFEPQTSRAPQAGHLATHAVGPRLGQGSSRVALRTAHASFVSALGDRRQLGHAKSKGDLELWQLVRLRAPLAPTEPVTVRVSGRWVKGSVWCVRWVQRGAPPLPFTAVSSGSGRTPPLPLLRLCFDAASGTEYWDYRQTASSPRPESASLPPPAAVTAASAAAATSAASTPAAAAVADDAAGAAGAWLRLAERPLSLRQGDAFEVEVRPEGGMLRHTTQYGGTTHHGGASLVPAPCLAALPLQLAQVEVRAADATLRGVRLLIEAGSARPLPLQVGSMKGVEAEGAPAPFEAAREERGPATYRVRGPCLLGVSGGLLRLLVQVSSAHACGASDDLDTRAAEVGGQTLSFVAMLTVREATGELVGPMRALTKLNQRLTRGEQWGDGPEAPRALQVKGRLVVFVWARTWQPETSAFLWRAATRDVHGEGGLDKGSVVRLVERGCERCAAQAWSPFTHRGELYAEVGLEPRRVLRVDVESGEAWPCNGSSATGTHGTSGTFGASHAAAAALQLSVGALLLVGPPAVRLPLARGSKLFLGLAHFTSRPAGNTVPARSYHLFYVFAARPPFELVGLGRPFTLPSELRLTQVAT